MGNQKRKAGGDGGLPKPSGWKKKWKNKKKHELPETVPEPNLYEVMEEKKTKKSAGQKKGDLEKGSRSEATIVDQYSSEAYQSKEADIEKNNSKLLRKKKRKRDKVNTSETGEVDGLSNSVEDGFNEQDSEHTQGKKKDGKSGKKERRVEKSKKAGIDKVNVLHNVVVDGSKEENEWITEYHQSRPGFDVLQQRIDDFMTAHEAQEEQARKEKEALAAEGGWTVVVHQKGQKKTTDTEIGITMGSVAEAAVLDKMSKKKKTKDVGVDLYRFQKREAQRNEVMALQIKFEQDKKRIQQLRAARKFRPY